MTRQQWNVIPLTLVGLLMSGCANTLMVTYISDPPSATLYANNTNFGYTPVTLKYQVTEEERKIGRLNIQGPSVQWASGAKASVPSINVDLNIGYNQQFTFNRPADHPNREEDVRFALELQRLEIMERQARAQQLAARVQMFNAINNQIIQRPQNCYSYALGATIQTVCN